MVGKRGRRGGGREEEGRRGGMLHVDSAHMSFRSTNCCSRKAMSSKHWLLLFSASSSSSVRQTKHGSCWSLGLLCMCALTTSNTTHMRTTLRLKQKTLPPRRLWPLSAPWLVCPDHRCSVLLLLLASPWSESGNGAQQLVGKLRPLITYVYHAFHRCGLQL